MLFHCGTRILQLSTLSLYLAMGRDGKQAGKARQRNRGDAGDLSEAEEEEHFLSLDDTLEEGTGLDLEDDEGLDEDYGPVRPPAALLALTAAPEAEGDLAGVRVSVRGVKYWSCI